MTASLRTFARADDEAFTAVSLDEVIRLSCRLSESTVRLRARLDLDLAPLPLVRGSRGKLGQVVTNLLVNAIQAVPEGASGQHVIRLTTRASADFVTLAVEDSGPGVAAVDRERIFEPFFTTKDPDLGTGLGLALVAEIVQAHGGTISVGDSPLGGARFEVVLPVTLLSSIRTPVIEPAPVARRPRVLLIDDEQMLLRLFESLLTDRCDVVTAPSGAQALAILREDRAFDLVLCDLHMPGTDGVGVHEAATAFAPELRARFVFATGGAVTARCRAFLDEVRPRVLQKPFDVSALFDLLRV